jgi:hypothetical protein
MTRLPPFVLAAAAAFWGWESDQLALGLALGAALEIVPRLRWRLDLPITGYERLADLCSIAFVALIGAVVATGEAQRVSRGILTGLQYLPLVLAPLALAQLVSSEGRLRLSALFRHLRVRRRRDPSFRDPRIDFTGPYFAVVLVAAGVANDRTPVYFAGLALLVGWRLFALRPRHVRAPLWAAVFSAAVIAGYAGQFGLTQLQAALEAWVADWYLSAGSADPYRSATDLGSIGRLKQYDAIVLRVYAEAGDAERVRLLHRSSFNRFGNRTWSVRNAPLEPLAPEADESTWQLAPGEPRARVRIAEKIEGGKALLALPAGALRVTGLPTAGMQANALGAVQAEAAGDWITYGVLLSGAIAAYSAPVPDDAEVPEAEREVLQRLAARLGLAGLAPAEAARRVHQHLGGFSYSTFRARPAARGMTPLGDFLEHTRSGHCEYFAAAATLLLRTAGIPARYATGFAVLEYSPLEQAFVVRARHAHSWTRYWDGARWQELDPTPPQWFAEEEKLAPAWQSLSDLARWAGFRWSQRGAFTLGPAWYALLAALGAVLAWRIARGRRVQRAGSAARAEAPGRTFAGADSEFYAIEARLARRAAPRAAGEPLERWVARAAADLEPGLRARLLEALALHQRYRFDPRGLRAEEREALRERSLALAGSLD